MNINLIKTVTTVFSLLLIGLGALGMIISFVFMWSYGMKDIVGAGFGFIAGAIMLSSGVISLSIIANAHKE